MKLIGQGFDIKELARYDSAFAHGQQGRLDLYMLWKPTQEKVDRLQEALVQGGLALVRPVTATLETPSKLSVHFRAASPSVALAIPVLVGAGVVAVILGFAVYRVASEFSRQLVPLALIAGATLVGMAALSRTRP